MASKQELIDAVALNANITKRDAKLAIEATLAFISDTVKTGENVTVQGFGSFRRKLKQGRNFKTNAGNITTQDHFSLKFEACPAIREDFKTIPVTK